MFEIKGKIKGNLIGNLIFESNVFLSFMNIYIFKICIGYCICRMLVEENV